MNNLDLAKSIQHVAEQCLTSDFLYTNVEEWKELQIRLSAGLNALSGWEGATPDEEAERLLAILMGHCVSVKNDKRIDDVLSEAEMVLPKVQDSVLRCHLAVFCYMECPDEELGRMVRREMLMLKDSGKGEEIRMLEKMLEDVDIKERGAVVQ